MTTIELTSTPALSFSHQYEDDSLSYTTTLEDSAHNINIPLLLIIHQGKLVHTQEISEETGARLEAKFVREYSDGSLVYHFSLIDASHNLYMRLMCVVFEGRVEDIQSLTLEAHYSEQAQSTARMMQTHLDLYTKHHDIYFLDQFLFYSEMNAEWRANLMSEIEA